MHSMQPLHAGAQYAPMVPPRMHYRSQPVTVAVDPGSLVISECIAITSALQKHTRSPHSSVAAILGGGGPSPIGLRPPSSAAAERDQSPGGSASARGVRDDGLATRWGLRGQKGRSMQDDPLMSGFGKLRHDISAVKDIHSFDALTLIEPFLQVIQAKGTAAPITTLALGALRRFLAYGLISPASPRFPLAMQSLSAAVTRCHFDGSDSGQIEVVLSSILHLMEDMMSGPGGDILSDESVCEMMGRGLAICSQPRFSPVLRRTAETSMVRMCQIIFEDIKHLEVEAGIDSHALEKQSDTGMDTIRIDASPSSTDNVSKDIRLHKDKVEPCGRQEGNNGHGEREPRSKGPLASQEEIRQNIDVEEFDAEDVDLVWTNAPISLTRSQPPLDLLTLREGDDSTVSGVERADGDPTSNSEDNGEHAPPEQDPLDVRPYSLPSVRELFRVLVSFLDPHDRQHTDTMRAVSLRIIHVALEVAGPLIARHPSLAILLEDRLCCYLFQLVRSDNMTILQESLTVTGTLLATCRGVLKLQQELYLSYLVACLHPLVDIPSEPGIDPSLYSGIPQAPKLVKPPPSQAGSGHSTPVPVKDRQKLGLEGGSRKPDARQAMVESIGVLARMPTFMIELFINYDCDEDRADLCEDMVGLLARNALPDSAAWSTTSVPPLCLDALLRYVNFIVARLGNATDGVANTHTDEGLPCPDDLRRRRQLKKVVVLGASKFNENPRVGLEYLCGQGVITDANNPNSVASFLKATSRVSKKVMGEFLSKKGNEDILEAYMKTFNFTDKRVDEALRIVLETFRLPGEAPLISRIVTAFCEAYTGAGTAAAGAADKDAVFILTYAIILLNTDQHNPNVKHQRRMKLEDFARNLRGQNAGQNFAPQYLAEIYDSIKANEIILPDEHDNKHAFDYAWRELLVKTEAVGTLVSCDSNIYDSDMFAATWRPIVSTLSYVFMSATDDAVFARIVTGFDECARIAVRYRLTEALDHIVYCLSHMTTLATDTLFSTKLNTEVQAGENSRVMVSELAVKLGRDVRAQLATLVLFRVVTGSEAVLEKGWTHIVRIWLNLFVNSLVPAPFLPSGPSTLAQPSPPPPLPIDPIPLHTPSQVVERGVKSAETGFFSAFTSYISSYAADDPPEPSDEELESTLCTVDCITSCHLDDIFTNILSLHHTSLVHVIAALLGEVAEDGQMSVITVKTDNSGSDPTNPSTSNGDSMSTRGPDYDPSLVYILECCTVLSCKDSTTTEAISRPVINTLMQLLRTPGRFHHLVTARATFYALKLLSASYALGYANVPVLLHAISSFSLGLLSKAYNLILQGIALCSQQPGPLRNELMTSPDFWAILHTLARIPGAAPAVFDIIELNVSDTPLTILAGHYEAVIDLLNEFATTAGTRPSHVPNSTNTTPRKTRKSSPSTTASTDLDQRNIGVISRGMKAISMVYQMTGRVPQLMQQSHLDSSEAWSAYWLPIFQAFTTQCTNSCRDVRSLAFTSLQRSLLSPDLVSTDANEWISIFGKVLFPLILKLLRPEVFSSQRDYMGEMRVQTASLLCKVYLQYLVLLSTWDGMLDLWLRIIDIMDRLINSGQGDSLEEAVRENLKNVVLFMSSNGFLVSKSEDKSKQQLWLETWTRIDRFLPDLREELALEDASITIVETMQGTETA